VVKHESANKQKRTALALSGAERRKQVTVHNNNKRKTAKQPNNQSANDPERKSICQKVINNVVNGQAISLLHH
jgi:hypothetical protein